MHGGRAAPQQPARGSTFPAADALAGLHDPLLVAGRQVDWAAEDFGPVCHVAVVVGVADGNAAQAPQAADLLLGALVQERNEVPQEVAVL